MDNVFMILNLDNTIAGNVSVAFFMMLKNKLLYLLANENELTVKGCELIDEN